MEDRRLQTQLRQKQEACVVDVKGEIDISTVPAFKAAVGEATESAGHVIINMEDVTYMDSSGFGTLLSATKKLRPEGGSIHLVGCNDIITRMLRITRLNTIFEMHASEDDALRALPTNGHAAPTADGSPVPVR